MFTPKTLIELIMVMQSQALVILDGITGKINSITIATKNGRGFVVKIEEETGTLTTAQFFC